MKEKFEKRVKMLKPGYDGLSENDLPNSAWLYFTSWEKYGKSRIYINDYKGRKIAYIDKRTKKINEYCLYGVTREEYDSVLNDFLAKYEF